MVAATPLTADAAGNAGQPGYCCIPGCGRRAATQLCARCFAVHADEAGVLPAWVLGLRREATRLAVREHRARRAGVSVVSYDCIPLAFPVVRALASEPGGFDGPRDPQGKFQGRGLVAPGVTDFLRAGEASGLWADPLALLRRYSHWGVPLDMPAFLALLGDLFGWPPPGMVADQRHREALIDLYERVYEA